MNATTTYTLFPIGTVRRSDDGNHIEIDAPFRPALKALNQFSHVMVFWWAHGLDTPEYRAVMTCVPPYAPDHESGMFATRSPQRPNPIMASTCPILSVDEKNGVVRIGEIDAIDGTPVVDLKAYFPVCDRVREASIPSWLAGWPEWMPDEGIGLMDGEAE